MPSQDMEGELRRALWAVVKVLEPGYWRTALRSPEVMDRPAAGPRHLVRWALMLRLVARSQQLQAQGRLQDAWDRLAEATKLLPPELIRFDASSQTPFVALHDLPSDTARDDVTLVVSITRLVWREQFELQDLMRTFAPGRMKAHDELVEAIVQYLFWVEFDPSTYRRRSSDEPVWDDGVTVDRSRSVFCRRASEIRRLGDPSATVAVSQAPWQDGGGFRGLYPDALDLLAERAEPAPWCGRRGTSGLVVRRGRFRAWQHARQRRQDLDSP